MARDAKHEQQMLDQVRQATEGEAERVRHDRSAGEVYTNVHRGLTSAPAKKVHQTLRTLKRPAPDAVGDAFDRRAAALGVGGAK